MLFSTPQCRRASRTRSGRTSAVMISSGRPIIAHGTSGRPDEIITAEVRPDLVREARRHWGVENR
jgi:predicted amidohydrolase